MCQYLGKGDYKMMTIPRWLLLGKGDYIIMTIPKWLYNDDYT